MLEIKNVVAVVVYIFLLSSNYFYTEESNVRKRTRNLWMPERDPKVMTLPPIMEKRPMDFKELFLMPKFDNSITSVTRDKEFCQGHVIMR